MTATVLFTIDGITDTTGTTWSVGELRDANTLLTTAHYLGPARTADLVIIGTDPAGEVVATQVYRSPTSRHLPSDGTWIELSRWCLTPAAGDNAGSRQHAYAVRRIRTHLPRVTTIVSYSDPSVGHTGALYRACNYLWRPTWHRLRTPPTGNGSWEGAGGTTEAVKDRWIFPVTRDPARDAVLTVDDAGAIAHFVRTATFTERRWALTHPQLGPLIAERAA